MTAGPVEIAIRGAMHTGDQLVTPTRSASFSLGRLDANGVVLLIGAKEAWTPMRWACLEGVVAFLHGQGWVEIGGKHASDADPSTLDGYLRACLRRSTGSYVAAHLERAGVLEIDRGRPARVRLSAHPPG